MSIDTLRAELLVIAAVLALAFLPELASLFPALPEIGRDAGLAVLFVAGLATSLHCVAMCGGISLAQSLNSRTLRVRPLRANGLYNLGRMLSYAGIGAAAGALGEVLTPGPQARATVFLAAGGAMILLGLRLSGLVPALQRIHLRIVGVFAKPGRPHGGSASGSFAVGLLNGFMPCGPLQAMQLYALSSGGPAEGAVAMLAFGLGTVPAMLFVGMPGGRLDRRHAGMRMRVSALRVAVLGVALLRNGAAIAGLSLPGLPVSGTAAVTEPGEGTQVIVTDLDWGTYPVITVRAGASVRWNLRADPEKLNGCNDEIVIPALGITKKLEPGDNIIDFTPEQPGRIDYACWMGMISGSILVIGGDGQSAGAPAPEAVPAASAPGGAEERS